MFSICRSAAEIRRLKAAVGNLFGVRYHEEPWNQTKQMRQRGQKFGLQVRRKSVLFRYPSLNLELRWLTPGTDP